MISRVRSMASLSPTRRAPAPRSSWRARERARARPTSRAPRRVTRTASGVRGFSRKWKAPRRVASMASPERGLSAHHDHRSSRTLLQDPGEEVQAGLPRKDQVQEHRLGPYSFMIRRASAPSRLGHPVPLGLQEGPEHASQVPSSSMRRIVIPIAPQGEGKENLELGAAAGSVPGGHRAAVGLEDLLDQGKAEPRPPALRRELRDPRSGPRIPGGRPGPRSRTRQSGRSRARPRGRVRGGGRSFSSREADGGIASMALATRFRTTRSSATGWPSTKTSPPGR
jgi:hypothetical protein